ncbi:MAG TPA: biotin/lipoyl-containing protein [Vicinamibacterales bacterium]|nr:biotin/lipoyl-containing protein [Vicinamibacterales bacterium]
MTFEIEVNGTMRTASIETIGTPGASGGRFRIRVDGVVHELDATVTDLGLSLVYADTGRGADVAVTERAPGELLLQFPRVMLTALVDARRFRRGGAGPAAAAGEVRVLAPMPGRVLRVLVKPGDEVGARQGLVVIEAMKMENEIGAPKAGRIKEVAVTDGQSVESGRLLVVVE